MNVPIRRVDATTELPEYKTKGAAAMDCYVREDVVIPGGGIGYAFLNFALKIPTGHFALLAARSSLHKRGLMMANGVGIFDEDFAGDEDEFRAILYNFTKEDIPILKGERVAQVLILPVDRVELIEVETLGNKSRGGLGTTGI